jgi:hypothetical protein
MQQISTVAAQTLERDVSLEIYSRVIAEWEINSYFEPDVDGTPSVDEEMFPMDSVALPRRPRRAGLPKLIANQGRITGEGVYPRYRVPSPDANYKYYHSGWRAGADGVFADPVVLQLFYDQPVPVNKLVIGFETSWAQPQALLVEITYNGIDWVSLPSPVPDADGLVTIWLQENGTWGDMAVLYEENYVHIYAVRVTVYTITGENALSIIQISPRLAMDMTNRVIDVSVDRQAEELNLSNPIGTSAAGTCNIQLANDDRLFDQENTDSILHNLIDRNVRFDVSDVLVRGDGVSEAFPQGVFFADEWSVPSDGTTTVSGSDRSKFLQETFVENSFYWNQPAEYVVKDILDRFGHPDWEVLTAHADTMLRIPYTFFKDEQTVWNALQSLAQAEQASFYFDEQDRFVWKSRDYTWQNATPVWTLRNDVDGDELPNIIEWNPRFELGANKVNIKYTKLAPATDGGQVVNNVIWENSETLVLNATVLRGNIPFGAEYFRIRPEDKQFWPESGFVNINGEYISYEKNHAIADRMNIIQRGLYGSTVQRHYVNPEDNHWRFRVARTTGGNNYQKIWSNSVYGNHKVQDSYVELSTPGGQSLWNTSHYFVGSLESSYAYYGTELVFPVSFRPLGEPFYDGQGVAGMMLHHDGDWNGYYFEMVTTQFAVASNHRKAEIRCWRRSAGVPRFIGSSQNLDVYPEEGRLYDILPGERYRMDILYRRISGQNHFEVFVNGTSVLSIVDTAPGTKRTRGYWGLFTRAKTVARFDAAWAMSSPLSNDELTTVYSALRDRTSGGFVSGTLENAWKKFNRKRIGVIYEDFGPIVHGGQEFDVDYEIAPNTATDLFVSNEDESFVVFHERDPFSSHFAIVNKAREDAVIVGSDPRRDNQQMSMFVYGRPIVEEDESNITREDTLSIRRRGLEELELASPWIQTKTRAERIADWLVERWGKSNDIVEVDVIVSPHLQLGDLVQINAPSENLFPTTHRYNVVAISKTVGSGHSMSVTLRRRR